MEVPAFSKEFQKKQVTFVLWPKERDTETQNSQKIQHQDPRVGPRLSSTTCASCQVVPGKNNNSYEHFENTFLTCMVCIKPDLSCYTLALPLDFLIIHDLCQVGSSTPFRGLHTLQQKLSQLRELSVGHCFIQRAHDKKCRRLFFQKYSGYVMVHYVVGGHKRIVKVLAGEGLESPEAEQSHWHETCNLVFSRRAGVLFYFLQSKDCSVWNDHYPSVFTCRGSLLSFADAKLLIIVCQEPTKLEKYVGIWRTLFFVVPPDCSGVCRGPSVIWCRFFRDNVWKWY